MSPQASVPAGWRAWPAQLRHALLDLRGAAPAHTLYLGAQDGLAPAVQAWSGAAFERVQTAPSFDAWCAAHPGTRVRLCVSAHRLHGLVVDPTLALPDAAALQRYARQQFCHYHGDAVQAWPLATWSLGAGATRSHGACALHALDLGALRASAARHGVRLRSVTPAALAGLASLTRQQPSLGQAGRRGLAIVEGRLLTWLVVDAGRLVGWQQRFLERPSRAALAELLAQLVSEASQSSTALVEPPRVRHPPGSQLGLARRSRPARHGGGADAGGRRAAGTASPGARPRSGA